MKIKVGDKIYDPNETPLMVILSDSDKANIANMLPEATKYCVFPDTMSEKEIERWMSDPENVEARYGCGAQRNTHYLRRFVGCRFF